MSAPATQRLLGEAPAPAEPLSLWYRQPATEFTQALPLGNGRLGAMVYGGVEEERLVLNEGTLWSGGKEDADRPDAAQYLPEIRRLLLAGKNAEAEKLVYANFTCQGKGSNRAKGRTVPYGSYELLGNLRLRFANSGAVSNYRRDLNLSEAVARVAYEQNGVRYQREVFSTAADQSLVMRLTADRPGQLSFTVTLDRPERAEVAAEGTNGLLMSGQLNNGTDGKGMKYAARLRVLNRNGAVRVIDNAVRVNGADEVVLFLTAATDYQGFAGRRTPDVLAASAADMKQAVTKSYATLLAAHRRDYQRYFQRVELVLGADNAALPTDERLRALTSGARDNDPGLMALYFQYGRYLLISSSRVLAACPQTYKAFGLIRSTHRGMATGT
ncbi:MAG: glycoside hydrolase family 95 protein [Blastocatellia bacterium]